MNRYPTRARQETINCLRFTHAFELCQLSLSPETMLQFGAGAPIKLAIVFWAHFAPGAGWGFRKKINSIFIVEGFLAGRPR
jgi:hypothetical protein